MFDGLEELILLTYGIVLIMVICGLVLTIRYFLT